MDLPCLHLHPLCPYFHMDFLSMRMWSVTHKVWQCLSPALLAVIIINSFFFNPFQVLLFFQLFHTSFLLKSTTACLWQTSPLLLPVPADGIFLLLAGLANPAQIRMRLLGSSANCCELHRGMKPKWQWNRTSAPLSSVSCVPQNLSEVFSWDQDVCV